MGRYIQRVDIENWFGIKNVKTYADKDGDGDLTKIADQITNAIAKAEDEVDNRFRGARYVIPFSPVPEKVKDWAAKNAGVFLYQGRGLRDTDTDNRMDAHLDDVDAEIKSHVSGMRQLVASLDGSQPNIPIAQ